MSSKKDKEKSDTITIETTQLKINIKSTGDLTTKEFDLIPFHPNMADLRDLSNNSYILFPSFVKITMKDLKKAGVGEDYPKVFMNLDKYIKLIKYVTNPDKEEDYTLFIDKSQVKNYTVSLAQNAFSDLVADNMSDAITIQKNEPLTKEEIIVNNIELIKSIFLPVKSHFFILGNDYVIGQSKYMPPYVASSEKNTKLEHETAQVIPLVYTVRFELQLLDAANNPDAGDFSKMTCKAKKGNIAKDMKDIFGTNFGYVAEKKAAIPSILNTSKTTQNRQFSKLQKEWEERNKFVKPPTNERERLAIEKNWTPIQRKMAEFDKKQAEYNKIPPFWIKETEDLNEKYKRFITDMVKLWREMAEIEKSNAEKIKADPTSAITESVLKDMIAVVADKMKDLATRVLLNEREKMPDFEEKSATEQIATLVNALATLAKDKPSATITEVENKIIGTDKSKYEENTDFYQIAKKNEQRTIDYKFVKPLLAETNFSEKEKDLIYLKKQEQTLIDKINRLSSPDASAEDRYNVESVKAELAKVHANMRKKEADTQLITQKYTTPNAKEPKKVIIGNVITDKWKLLLKDMDEKRKSIEAEKTKEEKKIIQETVKDELKKKKKDIDDLRKELLIADYKEGKEENTSKSENESYDKKEKPLDSAETIRANLETAKQQYLDIYGRLGLYYRIQAEVTLLSDDLTRIKELKSLVDKDKEKRTDKIKSIVLSLSKFSDTEKEKAKNDPTSNPTISALQADNDRLQGESKIFTEIINKLMKEKGKYEDYLKVLKGISEKNVTNDFEAKKTELITLGENVPTKKLNIQAPTLAGGGSRKKKHTLKKRVKKYKKTKRARLIKMKKTIRKWQRKLMRKKKQTRRRKV
jgi:hypothetical protein